MLSSSGAASGLGAMDPAAAEALAASFPATGVSGAMGAASSTDLSSFYGAAAMHDSRAAAAGYYAASAAHGAAMNPYRTSHPAGERVEKEKKL